MDLFDFAKEAEKRDRALDLLEEHRGDLIQVAKELALELANKNGTVTGAQVLRAMRAMAIDGLEDKDPRFMGAVFRAKNGWERVGHSSEGSHRRPVSVWRRK